MDFAALSRTCAAAVHPLTMAAVVRVESGFNRFAIGVVGARLERQPATKAEAVATARALASAGYNFSLGLSQVNRHNLSRLGLDYESAFEPCANLQAGAAILNECYVRAKRIEPDEQQALQAAFSCYYSGNFTTGFKPDVAGQPSYVHRVLRSAGVTPIPVRTRVSRPASSPKSPRAEVFNVSSGGARRSQGSLPSISDDQADSVLVFR